MYWKCIQTHEPTHTAHIKRTHAQAALKYYMIKLLNTCHIYVLCGTDIHTQMALASRSHSSRLINDPAKVRSRMNINASRQQLACWFFSCQSRLQFSSLLPTWSTRLLVFVATLCLHHCPRHNFLSECVLSIWCVLTCLIRTFFLYILMINYTLFFRVHKHVAKKSYISYILVENYIKRW